MLSKRVKILIGTLFLGLLLVIGLRLLVFDIYQVPSASMTPTIEPGNYLLVSKALPEVQARIMNKQNPVCKGEIWVFYKPEYHRIKGSGKNFKGLEFVKRCVGLPGDSITICKPSFESLTGYASSLKQPDYSRQVFPHNDKLRWTLTKFGPLLVPKKNTRIPLNERNVILYRDIISLEGHTVQFKDGKALLNDIEVSSYSFKSDYFFMMGDNFYDSEDSRLWGLVPESNLIGKVMLVL
jgi:signal peptidase I